MCETYYSPLNSETEDLFPTAKLTREGSGYYYNDTLLFTLEQIVDVFGVSDFSFYPQFHDIEVNQLVPAELDLECFFDDGNYLMLKIDLENKSFEVFIDSLDNPTDPSAFSTYSYSSAKDLIVEEIIDNTSVFGLIYDSRKFESSDSEATLSFKNKGFSIRNHLSQNGDKFLGLYSDEDNLIQTDDPIGYISERFLELTRAEIVQFLITRGYFGALISDDIGLMIEEGKPSLK
jgi:hypothetical protein